MKRAYIQPKMAFRKTLLQTIIAQSPTPDIPYDPTNPPIDPGTIDSKERAEGWDEKGLW